MTIIMKIDLQDIVTPASRKPKAKKKMSDDTVLPIEPDESERQGTIFVSFSVFYSLLRLI